MKDHHLGEGVNKVSKKQRKRSSEPAVSGKEMEAKENDIISSAPDKAGRKDLRKRLIGPLILTALMLILSLLAIRDNTSYPSSIPQNPYWTDNIVTFLASYKEVIAIILSLLCGLYMFVRIPKGLATRIWTVVWALLIPGLSFIAVEAYNKGFWHVGAPLSYENAEPMSSMFLLNMLLYYLFFLGLAFLLGSFRLGYGIASGFLMGIAIVNFYVQQFRGSPIVPWDFLSIRTANNVAGNFEYKIYWQMLLSTFAFVFIILTCGKMRSKPRFLAIRIPACILALGTLVFVVSSLQNDDTKSFWGIDTTLFTPNVRYTKNGFWPAFLANLSFLNIDKPEGYSVEKVEEIASEADAQYDSSRSVSAAVQNGQTEQTAAQTQELTEQQAQQQTEQLTQQQTEQENTQELQNNNHKTAQDTDPAEGAAAEASSQKNSAVSAQNPNIIVIMNEAFSDLSILGEFNTSEDYMPNFRALMEEYTSGHLLVSVKGGNTANTEYEFLSGDTTAFLPQGSVVFQQYISDTVPTIASYLGGLGYETIGMHPYQGSGWERDRVYPLMGFDEFLDQGSFPGADKLRNYVSDKGAFDKVIELFENKEPGQSQFQFLVTMQNHSGYSPKSTDNGFTEEVLLTDATYKSSSVIAAERYLTLIKYSDAAFRDLIDYFEENVTEPTMIVMFGDHEPNDYVTDVIDDLVGNDSSETASDNSKAAEGTEESLTDVEKHYQVPFVIWNNFGVEKDESVDLTSTNYLGAMILEEAGLPLSSYHKFLLNQQETLPAVAAGAYVDAENIFHSWAERADDDENGGQINAYNILEYNHLIDNKNRVDSVFLESGAAG